MNKPRTGGRSGGSRSRTATSRNNRQKRKLSVPRWASRPARELLEKGREIFQDEIRGHKNEAARRFHGIADNVVRGVSERTWSPFMVGAGIYVYNKYESQLRKQYADFKGRFDSGGTKGWKSWYEKIIGTQTGLGESSSSIRPRISLLHKDVGPTMTDTPGAMGIAGQLYRDRWHINGGGSDKQLTLAKNLWKLRTVPLYETSYTDNDLGGTQYFASQNSQCGINRRGWYLPWPGSSAFTNYISNNDNADQLVYDAAGTIQARHLYKFWTDNIPNGVFDYLSDANTGNVEMYMPLQSTWSTHQIQNRTTQSSVVVSAYLVRCVESWMGHPLRTVYNWDLSPTGTMTDTRFAPALGPDGRAYYAKAIKKNVKVGEPGGAVPVLETWDVETPTRPAVTPSLSPLFRKKFEIVDVMHKELEPNDSWELTFKQTFKRPLKWSMMKSMFSGKKPFSDMSTYDTYNEGDYEVFFSFAGNPGSVSGYAQGEITGTVANPVIQNFDPINVENQRCRISKTVKHSLSVAWPNLESKTTTGANPGVTPDELINNGFISVSERLPETGQKWAEFEREQEVDGTIYLIPNWPAIGTAEAAPVLGTVDARVEGDPKDIFRAKN